MKKIISLLLSLGFLLSLTGCGQKESAPASSEKEVLSSHSSSEPSSSPAGDEADFTLYKQALENLKQQAETGALRCTYCVENDSGSYSATTSGDMALSYTDGFHFYVATGSEAEGGVSTKTALYSDGQTVYMHTGAQTRRQLWNEEAEEKLRRLKQSYTYGLIDPADAAYTEITAEEAEDGVAVSFILDSEALSSVEQKYEAVFGTPFKINSMQMEGKIDSAGRFISAGATGELVTTTNGQIASYTMNLQLSFSALGGDISVIPPADMDIDNAQAVDSLWY